jgi:serine/threonine-protein kinase
VTSGDARVGTVAYMSPEQASSAEVDERTDIWSLGVVMYELMAGRLPFPGDIDVAILYAIRSEPHTPLRDACPDVPEACAAVVERCLAKDPAQRYPNVEALLADMVAAAHACGWSDTVASRTIAPILAAKRRRAWTRRVAIAAAVLIAAAGAWWLWSRRGPPSPYSTQLRIAVVPFDNLLDASNDDFTLGLAEYIARTLDALKTERGSMWTVFPSTVAQASLGDPFDARESFGVNRLVTGSVQRFENYRRLTIELRDAATRDVLASEFVDVDERAAATMLSDLSAATARMMHVDGADLAVLQTSSGDAALAFLTGIGRMAPPADSLALTSAIASLDACVGEDSSFAAGVVASGAAHVAAFNLVGGSEHLARASERARSGARLAPSYAPAALLRGDVDRLANETDAAIEAYRAVLALAPGHYTATHRLAGLYMQQARLDEAETTYRDLLSVAPDYYAARFAYGWFCYGQGRIDDAEREWKVAHTLAPHDVAILSNLGTIAYDRDDWPAARAMFLEAFRIRPSCESCNNIATTLYFDRKFDESARYFEFAFQYCDTNECDTWGNLASALYWAPEGRERSKSVYRTAIAKANHTLARTPHDPRLTALLIDYYSMSGDSAMTLQTIATAGNLLESDSHVMYSAGSAFEKMGRRELALRHLGDAVRHGYSLQVIRGAPLLDDLEKDPRFQELIRDVDVASDAQAAPKR